MSLYPDHVIAEVNSGVDIRRLLELIDYKTNKLQESNDTIRGFCPIHKEAVFRTLIIDKQARTFRCMYGLCEGSRGGSLVQLLALSRKVTTDEAVKELIDKLRLQISAPVDPAYLDSNVEIADNLLALDQDAEAERLYRQLLDMRSDFIRAHEGLLKIFQKRGDQALVLQALRYLARLHFQSAQYEMALKRAAECDELSPDDPEVKSLRAECSLAMGDASGALYAFMEVADQCEALGQFEKALSAYIRVEQLELDNGIDEVDVLPHILRLLEGAGRGHEAVSFLQTRAERLATQGGLDRAAELYAEAIHHDPNRLDLHERFVEIFVQAPLVEALVPQLMASVDLFKSHEMYEQAIRALECFNEQNPSHGLALQKLADLLYADGRPLEGGNIEAQLARMALGKDRATEGRDRLQRLLDWQPDHPEALEVLAEIDSHLGDIMGAVNARRRLAKSLTQRREFSRALEVLDIAQAMRPDFQDLLEQRAMTLETMGRTLNSDDALAAASEIYAGLANQHLENTDGIRELRMLERAAGAVAEPSPELLFRLARTHLRMGHAPQARDTVVRACEILVGSGHLEDAFLNADEFTVLMPGELDLQYYLVELCMRFDDTAGAVQRLRTLAHSEAEKGNLDEAERLFAQAQSIAPDDLTILDDMAAAFQAAGDEDRHLKTLMRAVQFHESRADWSSAIRSLASLSAAMPDDAFPITKIIDYADRLKRSELANEWRVALARAYRAQGDMEREARTLRDVLQRDPEQRGALRQLIEVDFDRGDTASAARSARQLAARCLSENSPEEARDLLASMVTRIPDQVELWQDLVRAARQAGDGATARRAALELVERLAGQQRILEAVSLFEELLSDSPEDIELRQTQLDFLERTGRQDDAAAARVALAQSLQTQERFDEAERLLLGLLEADAANGPARQALIDLYGRVGNMAALEEQLRVLAEVAHDDGDADRGLAALRRILTLNPDNAAAHRQLAGQLRRVATPEALTECVAEYHAAADAYRRSGNETEALQAEREAVDAVPDDLVARRRLVDAYAQLGRDASAAEELIGMARVHLAAGRSREAEIVLDEALSYDSTRVAIRRLRADVFTQMGQAEKALEEYRQLADMVDDSSSSSVRIVAAEASGPVNATLALVPEYVFESFVVGPANTFAHATCLAVAKNPARAYNPLFLYADVGMGKTHLINAIANHVMERDPRTRIIYTNSEDFTAELVLAIRENTMAQFHARYKAIDLLLLDDVQFLAGKERAQEEFFHIFNALFQSKRQIVLTSDRPPANLTTLESRLRSRFGSGVTVDIAPPDLETRLAILARAAVADGLQVDDSVLKALAERIGTNVRELKGAYNQVKAKIQIEGADVTVDNLHQLIDRIVVSGS